MNTEIYILETIDDNPIYEGFGLENMYLPSLLGRENILEDITPGYEASDKIREWKPVCLTDIWSPLKVKGRVAPFNDYPGVDGLPAFSKRACDILHNDLVNNGELLELDSDLGVYYLYNITTAADILDVEKSKCEFWCEPPTTAIDVYNYVFYKDRIKDLTIFRIFEEPMNVFVTDVFVNKVLDSGLNGFQFKKVWPIPNNEDWKSFNNKLPDKKQGSIELRKYTLIIILNLCNKKPNKSENKLIKTLENHIDNILQIRTINEKYYGHYEGSDIVNNEYRMFLSTPNVDSLINKLLPSINSLDWENQVLLVKRYGEIYDTEAKEAIIEI